MFEKQKFVEKLDSEKNTEFSQERIGKKKSLQFINIHFSPSKIPHCTLLFILLFGNFMF